MEARIGQDTLDGVVDVAKLVVGPGFVDEIFAGAACRNGFLPTFAAWDDVMVVGWNLPVTEDAFFHRLSIFLLS